MSHLTSGASTPSELRNLLHSNKGWAQRMRTKDSKFFKRTAEKESPKILWFGCSDSRVPESVILDALPGAVFTHRNIANQFRHDDASALSALICALEDLDIQHIVVCGHTNCVGVKKAFQTASTRTAKAKPHLYDHSHHDDDANAHTSTIIKQWIEPLVNLAVTQGIPEMGEKAGISKLMVESVKQQVSNIATTSVVKEAASSRRRPITIHGWIYDLETGELRDMDVSVQVPAVGPIYYGRLVDNLREHPHHSQPQSPISTYSSFYRPRGKKGKHDLVL